MSHSQNLLTLVPERRVTETQRVDGKAVFDFPRFRSAAGRVFGKLWGASPTIRLSLDHLSTAAWDLVDGRRDVQTIGADLAEQFGAVVEPASERLGTLLVLWEKNGLIRLRER